MDRSLIEMEANVKQQVREFYDQVGWQMVSDGLYQNARYEDLRPVAREYIHRCHLRVARFLKPAGHFLLDAGSGPIQYPEYLEYSRGYRKRVCADISITALKEARERIGDHGLFVVADVAHLPFKKEAFDGAVALHTIHHLPETEHPLAYDELYRMLRPGVSAVVVNGWKSSTFTELFDPLIAYSYRLRSLLGRLRSRQETTERRKNEGPASQSDRAQKPKSTFVRKHDADAFKQEVGARVPVEIRVWRSVNVRFMRAFIHDRLAGRALLRFLFWLEERLPRLMGEHGAYPLIVLRKPEASAGDHTAAEGRP